MFIITIQHYKLTNPASKQSHYTLIQNEHKPFASTISKKKVDGKRFSPGGLNPEQRARRCRRRMRRWTRGRARNRKQLVPELEKDCVRAMEP